MDIYAMAEAQRPFKEIITERIRNQAKPVGLTVQNKEGPKATLRIYDEIGFFGVTAEDVAATLESISADEIEVQINSVGGDAWEGTAIYNALRTHPARITTRVDGIAASAASFIAQAGDERIMLTGSQMMIHEAWGLAIGNAEVMRETADLLDKQSEIIAGIYEERSGREGFRALMQSETWFDPDEAVDAGLADKVVKPDSKAKNQIQRELSLSDAEGPKRFSDQLAEAVASVEKVTAETENVMTFRSEQGKPPLSEDAVALLNRASEALTRLTNLAEPPVTKTEDKQRHIDLLQRELEVTNQQLGVLSNG